MLVSHNYGLHYKIQLSCFDKHSLKLNHILLINLLIIHFFPTLVATNSVKKIKNVSTLLFLLVYLSAHCEIGVTFLTRGTIAIMLHAKV